MYIDLPCDTNTVSVYLTTSKCSRVLVILITIPSIGGHCRKVLSIQRYHCMHTQLLVVDQNLILYIVEVLISLAQIVKIHSFNSFF